MVTTWGTTGIWWVEAKVAAEHPTMHREAPPQRIIEPKMEIVLRLRNLDVKGKKPLFGNQKHNDFLMCISFLFSTISEDPLNFQHPHCLCYLGSGSGEAERCSRMSFMGCQFWDHVQQSPDAEPPGTDFLYAPTSGSGWLSKISRNNLYRTWPRGWKKSGKNFWLRGHQVQSTWILTAMR